MDIQKFINSREYLYHLTDRENLSSIFSDYRIKSAAVLARMVGVPNRNQFLRIRRKGHVKLSQGNFTVILRDQDPLFEKIVMKNLDPGWTFGDFVFSLNSRVFFWATERDLRTHYGRYEKQGELPKILKIRSAELFAANNHAPEFCRLNSGAPRCSSYYVEGAPRRGAATFQTANDYQQTPSSVREVTFQQFCNLPDNVWLSNHPDRLFRKV